VLKPRIDSKVYVVDGYRLEIPDNYCFVALTHCGGRPQVDALNLPGQERLHPPRNVFIVHRSKLRRFASSVRMFRETINTPADWEELLSWARGLKRTGEYGDIREPWQEVKANC